MPDTTEPRAPTGRAADGSEYTIGDDVLIRVKVVDISDAFKEVTSATVRIPERIGGVGFVTLHGEGIETKAPPRP
jgi:hypothetical protein